MCRVDVALVFYYNVSIMAFTSTQKIIKVGSSSGVILPAKALKELGVHAGDEIEVTARVKSAPVTDSEVLQTASAILERYKQDFKNLANR